VANEQIENATDTIGL